MRAVAGITFVLALGLSAAAAAQQGPWFGAPLPPKGLQDPPQLNALPKTPRFVQPAGETADPAFAATRIMADVRTITGFADEMERTSQFWGRISGTPAAAKTAGWVAAQLKSAGVQNVQVQKFSATGAMWMPTRWEVRVLADPAFGPGSRDVVLHSAMPTRGSSIPTPIEAELVYAGEAGSASTAGVRGKVAIQHSRPTTGAFSTRSQISSSARALNEAGAVAVFNWIEQAGNMHVFDFGGSGNAFNLGGADGAFLKTVLERSGGKPVKVRLAVEAYNRAGLTAENVVGVIPGVSDEIVVINAHHDSWFDGAGDNADATAVLIALARHYGRPENKPARTLLFVSSAGHHSSGMNGPAFLVRDNAQLLSKAVLVLNLEHVAQYQLRTDPWRVDPTEEPKGMGVSNLAPVLMDAIRTGAPRYGYTTSRLDASVPGDLGGYAPLNISRVQGIHSGPLYHTSGDVWQSISPEGLTRAANFYRYFIDVVAKAPKEQINPPGSNAPAPARGGRGGAAD